MKKIILVFFCFVSLFGSAQETRAVLIKSEIDDNKRQTITVSFKEQKEADVCSSLQDALSFKDDTYRNIAPSLFTYNLRAELKNCLNEVTSLKLNFEDAALNPHFTLIQKSLDSLHLIPYERIEISAPLSLMTTPQTKKKEKKKKKEIEAEQAIRKDIKSSLAEFNKKREEAITQQQEEARLYEEKKQQIVINTNITNAAAAHTIVTNPFTTNSNITNPFITNSTITNTTSTTADKL